MGDLLVIGGLWFGFLVFSDITRHADLCGVFGWKWTLGLGIGSKSLVLLTLTYSR